MTLRVIKSSEKKRFYVGVMRLAEHRRYGVPKKFGLLFGLLPRIVERFLFFGHRLRRKTRGKTKKLTSDWGKVMSSC